MKRNQQELTRTLVFAGVAVVAVLTAFAVDQWSQPEEIAEYEKVGELFFPDFDDPGKVKALEVAAYDKDSGKVVEFGVEYKDSAWRIRTHLGYPAEAEKRLAQTAASVIGVERSAVAGRRANQWARFGVDDPKDEELEDKSTAGSRISLLDEAGEVLAEYIIGKKVDGTGAGDDAPDDDVHQPARQVTRAQYYVRVPDEQETYRAYVTIDLSTKFEDWIDPDLLQVESGDLVDLKLHNYSVEVKTVQFPDGGIGRMPFPANEETNHLTKDGFSWELDGINEDEEEFESQKIRDLVSKIDGFKIVGVRRKTQYDGRPVLTGELTIDRDVLKGAPDPNELIVQLRQDLSSKGFYLRDDKDRPGEPAILADQGELVAATNQGVVYHLYYGSEIFGSDAEIQIGSADEGKSEDGEKTDGKDEDKDDVKKNRYVFLRVGFDESHIPDKPEHPGEAPLKPIQPPKPPLKPIEPPKPPEKTDKPESTEKNNSTEADPSKPTPPVNETSSEVSDKTDSNESTDCDEAPAKSGEVKSDEAAASDESKPADVTKPADKSDAPADETKPADEAKPTDEAKPADETTKPATEVKPGEENPGEKAEPKVEEPLKPKTPQEIYEEQLSQYEMDKAEYDRKLKEFEDGTKEFAEKVTKGKKAVARLSERFGDWFYVISSDSFEGLRLTRAELVKPKEKKEEDKKDDDAPKAEVKPEAPKGTGEATKPGTDKPDNTKPAPTKPDPGAPKPKADETGAPVPEKPTSKPESTSPDPKETESKPTKPSNPGTEPPKADSTKPATDDGESANSKTKGAAKPEPKDDKAKTESDSKKTDG